MQDCMHAVEKFSVLNMIGSLQKCRKHKILEYAKRMHAHINTKLEAHEVIGNHIVPMFVECGSMSDAQEVFVRLLNPNEYTWTSLILGYSECGQLQQSLNLYQKMQGDNVHPSCFTLMALVRTCAKLKDLERGRQIHLAIRRQEFLGDLFIGNALIDMYAKCGSPAGAKEVFDELPVKDVVSWTTLIGGYAENMLGEEALKCFEQMPLEGILPNAVTFACILKACGSMQAIEKGREMHGKLAQSDFNQDLSIGKSLVEMYVKCGSVKEAREVFNELPVRDVMSWTTLIVGYTDQGYAEEALKCFDEMQLEGVHPTAVTFICSLRACASIGAMDKGQEIHNDIERKGFGRELLIGNALIDMYFKCDSHKKAREVFDNLRVQDAISWNMLVAGYAKLGLGQKALDCFEQMQLVEVLQDAFTFVSVLKTCGILKDIDKGRQVHSVIVQRDLEVHSFLTNSLLGMYMKCFSVAEAQEVFDKLPVRDVVTWTAIISGYAENDYSQKALKCFEEMQREGVLPNAVTLICSLKACANIGSIDKGRELHAEIRKGGFERDAFVGNVLIDMYIKCGALVNAEDVFDKLPIRDSISWNALIAGFLENDFSINALRCYEEMQVEGVSPDAFTLVYSLNACGSMGFAHKGREVHVRVLQEGSKIDCFTGSALVDMYAKCGLFAEAQEVFDKLQVRDVVSWNALISGYAENGLGKETLQCLNQMELEKVPPDAVTFLCALKACSIEGALNKGIEIHTKIAQKGLERELLIGTTLVDMYAKGGLLLEAHDAFRKLPVQNVVSWNALITGYAGKGSDLEVLRCFEEMLLNGISPTAVTFVCALKACSNLGALDKGREIHDDIRQTGFQTNLSVGNALIDMYADCGSLAEAQETFEELLFRDVVTWTAIIRAHGISQDGNMAIQCFQLMQEQGVKPDPITFTCLLTACSRAGLLVKGLDCFHMMGSKYGISPTEDHYVCMADLLSRSGHLYEAANLLEIELSSLSKQAWTALLSACKSFGEAELGLKCSQKLIQMNPEDAAPYVVIANIYASNWQVKCCNIMET